MPNEPLGAKWNAALWMVPKGERVMVLGSDDMVSKEWWDMAGAFTADLVLPDRLAMWEPSSGRACVVGRNPKGAQGFGAGRVLSPRLRAAVGRMWPDDAARGLDTAAMARCRAAGFAPVVLSPERVPVCDVKTEANIWKMGDGWWSRKARQCSEDEAAWMLSHSLRQSLQR